MALSASSLRVRSRSLHQASTSSLLIPSTRSSSPDDARRTVHARSRSLTSRVIMNLSSLLSAALVLLLGSTGGIVRAADYPIRPIRLVMPNAPGSSADTLGRIVALRLGDALGQQIVVDNRAGAGGSLGLEIGKNAVP